MADSNGYAWIYDLKYKPYKVDKRDQISIETKRYCIWVYGACPFPEIWRN